MLRVPVVKIRPGMILARPIPLPHDPYRYLLQRDVEIPMDLVPRLKQLGILEVWIRHRELEFLEEVIDEGLADHQREVYVHVRQNFEAILRDTTAEIDFVHFQSSIVELFNFLKGSAGSDVLLQKLDAFDNYLMSHSTNVCYLALLLGMKLERYLIEQRRHKSAQQAKELHLLGLGCLLHDIGKMRIPKEILNKPGRLTPEEMSVMRTHTYVGYEMVKGSVPASAAQIVAKPSSTIRRRRISEPRSTAPAARNFRRSPATRFPSSPASPRWPTFTTRRRRPAATPGRSRRSRRFTRCAASARGSSIRRWRRSFTARSRRFPSVSW